MQTTKGTRANLLVDVMTPISVSVAVCASKLVTVVTIVPMLVVEVSVTQFMSSASEHAPLDVAVIAEGVTVAKLAHDQLFLLETGCGRVEMLSVFGKTGSGGGDGKSSESRLDDSEDAPGTTVVIVEVLTRSADRACVSGEEVIVDQSQVKEVAVSPIAGTIVLRPVVLEGTET